MTERHPPFEEWHIDNVIQFLKWLKYRRPNILEELLKEYDEWLMGN